VSDAPLPAPGWYPDPSGSPLLRWWDGERWSEDTHPLPGDAGEQPAQPTARSEGGAVAVQAPAPPAAAASHRGKAVALVAGFLVLLILSVAILTLGLGRTRLETKGIEEQIAGEIANELGSATTVTCPDLVDAGKGLSFPCTVKLDNGNSAEVKVTQTDDKGTVTWEVVPAE
jgi:hypothetical protein